MNSIQKQCLLKYLGYYSGGLYGISADGTVDSRSLFERVAALESRVQVLE